VHGSEFFFSSQHLTYFQCILVSVHYLPQPTSFLLFSSCCVKSKIKCTLAQVRRLCTGRTAHWGSRGIALLFLTTALEGMRGQRQSPAALYPWERPGTHCAGVWVGPRAGLDRCRKSRPPPPMGFDCQTIQPIASRYTNYATRPTVVVCTPKHLRQLQFSFPIVFPVNLAGTSFMRTEFYPRNTPTDSRNSSGIKPSE